MISDQVYSGSTPAEVYRATLPGRTPKGEPSTLIVTRQGVGANGRVWVTFNGAIRTTVVLTDSETAELRELLGKATRTGPDGSERGAMARGTVSSARIYDLDYILTSSSATSDHHHSELRPVPQILA
jgi:hypothetical protein